MQSLQQLKSRLKAVKNINQITKAMEVVSATKMRKAQEVALKGRPYAFTALDMIRSIINHSPIESPYLKTDQVIKKNLLVIVAADKGLAGPFNAQIFRAADIFLASEAGKNTGQVLVVGKKAEQYANRKGLAVHTSFSGIGDVVAVEKINAIVHAIIHGFNQKEFDQVTVISTHFHNALRQEALTKIILPVSLDNLKQTTETQTADYLFEPNPEELLSRLIPHLIKTHIYHLILEANASEHSARRLAMKSASDNALDLQSGLTLEYNKSRQAAITKEIIEITSTQSALN